MPIWHLPQNSGTRLGFGTPTKPASGVMALDGILRVAAMTVLAGNPILIMDALAPFGRDCFVFLLHQVGGVAVDTDGPFNGRSGLPGVLGNFFWSRSVQAPWHRHEAEETDQGEQAAHQRDPQMVSPIQAIIGYQEKGQQFRPFQDVALFLA